MSSCVCVFCLFVFVYGVVSSCARAYECVCLGVLFAFGFVCGCEFCLRLCFPLLCLLCCFCFLFVDVLVFVYV